VLIGARLVLVSAELGKYMAIKIINKGRLHVRLYHDKFWLVTLEFLCHEIPQGVVFFLVHGLNHTSHQLFTLPVLSQLPVPIYKGAKDDLLTLSTASFFGLKKAIMCTSDILLGLLSIYRGVLVPIEYYISVRRSKRCFPKEVELYVLPSAIRAPARDRMTVPCQSWSLCASLTPVICTRCRQFFRGFAAAARPHLNDQVV
jgi:hypothetical protein